MDNNTFQDYVLSFIESHFSGALTLIEKIISANGVYLPSDDNADGYSKVTVNVPQPSGTKHVSISQNGTITEDVEQYEDAEITVNVPVPTLESKSISANGTYTPPSGKAWNEVVVNVPISTPKVTGTFTLLSDAKPPTITHNLNTQKIAVIIVPNYSIAAHSGYKAYCVEYINMYEFIKDETWELDYTSYNSTRFPDVVSVNINDTINQSPYFPKVSAGQGSPWTTQTNYWQGEYSGYSSSTHVLTNNTYTYNDILCSGTYRYIIFSLE